MSLKQEIETWVQALGHYDNNEFEESLKTFDSISDTSKILFNCGVIHATLGEHDKAVECYQRAVRLDHYLAVAYFQQGVSNFLVADFEEALANFNDTLKFLRGNTFIDYDQLGLKFKLFSCEVLFNRGLSYIYMGQIQTGLADLNYAAKEKVTSDHDVIDEAIREEAENYTVFSIPVGVVYRPNSAKVKNLKTKDYLGKARLIAAADQGNTFTGFAGSEAKKNVIAVDTSKDDRPLDSISFAASNLVKPGLQSRSRQQSEPPVNRNMFPPTPPPDPDQVRPTFVPLSTSPPPNPPALNLTTRPTMTARANSVRNQPPRPERLDLSKPVLNRDKELPRLGVIRTASEPRGPKRTYSSPRSHRDGPPSRGRLFMEATPVRNSNGPEADIDEYPEELYEMYSAPNNRHPDRASDGHQHPQPQQQPQPQPQPPAPPTHVRRPSKVRHRSRSRQRPHYISENISENGEDADPPSNTSSLSDFDILNNASGTLPRPAPRPPSSRHRSRSRGTSRSRRPLELELKSIRVKVHSGDDTRYIMVAPQVAFEDFVDRVREKFGIRTRFKLKVRDEGDLITMGDRDDWDMAVQSVRKEAGKEGEEMGKMEIWIQEVIL
ncbi:hypothetical protein MMC07_002789 [Pseudocyphellaria aurata]|nr:hypothetical protein [Pseudocyphellaria aurata]